MKKSLKKTIALASLSIALCGTASYAQQQPVATPLDPFQLKAIVVDGAGNGDAAEGAEIGEGGSDSYGGADGAPFRISESKLDSTKAPLNAKAEASTDTTVPGKKLESGAEEAVSKAETGVDWSAWAAALADRWYTNLKNLEFTSKKKWSTVRPAQIQFTCHRDGHIGGILLHQSCGDKAYDTMQIEALKRCQPLAPFPEGSRRMVYRLIQGWEAHPRKAGESDYKPGSYGKNFPVERVPSHHKIPAKQPANIPAKPPTNTPPKATK
jgi:hypothetical protein